VQVFGFQIVVVYLVVIAAVVWWILERTPIGRYIYATGGNDEAARLSGVRVGKWQWIALMISGGLSALAGVFYASLVGPALTFGPALLLSAFAAVDTVSAPEAGERSVLPGGLSRLPHAPVRSADHRRRRHVPRVAWENVGRVFEVHMCGGVTDIRTGDLKPTASPGQRSTLTVARLLACRHEFDDGAACREYIA
jgi:hypothetical protein